MRNLGIQNVSGRGRGDLYVRVQVVVPRQLTSEQRSLLEDLGRQFPPPAVHERDGEDSDQNRPFFDRVKDIFG